MGSIFFVSPVLAVRIPIIIPLRADFLPYVLAIAGAILLFYILKSLFSALRPVNWIDDSTPEGKRRKAERYMSGRGAPQDPYKAVKLYLKAAEEGDAASIYEIGLCYEAGHVLPEDMKSAIAFYMDAADKGYAPAQIRMGMGLLGGSESAKAVEYFRAAAEQGDAEGQFCLGICYKNGEAIARDMEAAKEWFRRAAAQGHEGAASELKQLAA